MRDIQLPAMLTVRVPPDLLAVISAAAEQDGATRSAWLRQAISAAVEQGRGPRPAPSDDRRAA